MRSLFSALVHDINSKPSYMISLHVCFCGSISSHRSQQYELAWVEMKAKQLPTLFWCERSCFAFRKPSMSRRFSWACINIGVGCNDSYSWIGWALIHWEWYIRWNSFLDVQGIHNHWTAGIALSPNIDIEDLSSLWIASDNLDPKFSTTPWAGNLE